MTDKIERWCYGGKCKAFYKAQGQAIHEYNSKMMSRLLLIMTIIMGYYVLFEIITMPVSHYLLMYSLCFVIMLSMFFLYKYKKRKSIIFTRGYIAIFFTVLFAFVCIIGTFFEPDARAIMFFVYLLTLPMLFVIPTHYMYGFLMVVTCIFSAISFWVKPFEYAIMDMTHGITCLTIGVFISHHILESRIALYSTNFNLDKQNTRLDKDLQEKEIQLMQGRISIMLTQIQPHFLYNTLTAICGLCDVDPKEAKNVTAKFSDYLRHNLESLNQSGPISFDHELRHTQTYLEIEQKRFGERLKIVYDIQTTDFYIPTLTLQPIAENAVKHGTMKKSGGGTIKISTYKIGDFIEITVTDDGIGFDTAKPMAQPDTHIGIKNVRSRLQAICGGTLDISSQVGLGTTATIRIPEGNAV